MLAVPFTRLNRKSLHKVFFAEHFNEDQKDGNCQRADNDSDEPPFFEADKHAEKNGDRMKFTERACEFGAYYVVRGADDKRTPEEKAERVEIFPFRKEIKACREPDNTGAHNRYERHYRHNKSPKDRTRNAADKETDRAERALNNGDHKLSENKRFCVFPHFFEKDTAVVVIQREIIFEDLDNISGIYKKVIHYKDRHERIEQKSGNADNHLGAELGYGFLQR